jgi:hypothetical protein
MEFTDIQVDLQERKAAYVDNVGVSSISLLGSLPGFY